MMKFSRACIAAVAVSYVTGASAFIGSTQPRTRFSIGTSRKSSTGGDVGKEIKATDAELVVRTSGTNLVKSEYRPPQGGAFKQDIFPNVPQLITFDSTDTLIQLKSEVGMTFRLILHEASRFRSRLPTPAVFTDAFNQAYTETNEKYPCFGCGLGMTSREWWAICTKRTYALVEHVDYERGLRDRMDGPLGDAVAEVLYNQVFASTEAWELKPGVLDALSRFKMWREEGGPQLAVLSNFDERLHSILDQVGVADAFDFVLTSREIGSEKPNRSAFEVAMSRAGVADPSLCMHVGDGFDSDVVGASNAGWHSVWIPPINGDDVPTGIDPDLIFSMCGDLFAVLDIFGLDPHFRLIPTTRVNDERGNFMDEVRVYTEEEFDNQDGRLVLPAAPKSWEGPGRL